MLVERLKRTPDGKLPAYVMPGGYPLLYVTPYNDFLCADCATEALDDPDEYEECRPKFYMVYLEGPTRHCEECNKEIESAYGDPHADSV